MRYEVERSANGWRIRWDEGDVGIGPIRVVQAWPSDLYRFRLRAQDR